VLLIEDVLDDGIMVSVFIVTFVSKDVYFGWDFKLGKIRRTTVSSIMDDDIEQS
jgi:hypothetical protein